MTKHRVAVMLEIATSDPRLAPDAIDQGMTTVQGVARIRQAIVKSLPKAIERVVAVLPVEHAKALMLLHEVLGEDIAKQLAIDEKLTVYPPDGYVPPTRD